MIMKEVGSCVLAAQQQPMPRLQAPLTPPSPDPSPSSTAPRRVLADVPNQPIITSFMDPGAQFQGKTVQQPLTRYLKRV